MPNRPWYKRFLTYIWVFNTGRGLSVCIRLPNNTGIMYDLGSNEDFSPAKYIKEHIAPRLARFKKQSVSQCIISHPHADHISEIGEIESSKNELYPALLTCPNDKDTDEAVDFDRFINDDNRELIAKYRDTYKSRNPPLQSLPDSIGCNVPNVEYGLYYMKPPMVDEIYPKDNQKYINGLSLIFYLRHGHNTVLIPGDLPPEIMKEALSPKSKLEKRYTYFSNKPASAADDFNMASSSQPSLAELLKDRGLSVLLTPHHGLESCFSEDLFKTIKGGKTKINIISEKRRVSESDGSVDSRYQDAQYSSGLNVDIDGKREKRNSVSTKNGHHILIELPGTSENPNIYLRKDPDDLMNIL